MEAAQEGKCSGVGAFIEGCRFAVVVVNERNVGWSKPGRSLAVAGWWGATTGRGLAVRVRTGVEPRGKGNRGDMHVKCTGNYGLRWMEVIGLPKRGGRGETRVARTLTGRGPVVRVLDGRPAG